MVCRLTNLWIFGTLLALLAGCTDPEFAACRPVPDGCERGSEGCPCMEAGTCDAELACIAGWCEQTREWTDKASTGDPETSTDATQADPPECETPVYWHY